MLAEERRSRLLELIRVRRFAALPELAEALAVSESTIRRDVEHLEEEGHAQRIHGGVLYSGSSPELPHFELQQAEAWRQKKAIAELAAGRVQDGDTVLLDGGSTTYELARLLVGRPLHVVTNSLPVANLFAADGNSDLVLIGGNICPRTGVAQGPLADRMIEPLRVRRTILSVAGIDEEGCFNDNLLLVETERAMMRAADEVIVVADSQKFGRRSLARLCALGAITCLVSDDAVADRWRRRVEEAGVELLIAETPGEIEAKR
jgi:DeoR/GlpR family transcriptional regulator of sugar metabolism